METDMRRAVLSPGRNREGVFPSIDGFHGPRLAPAGPGEREYVRASEERKGSGPDYLAFLDRAQVEQGVVFTSEGLSVGYIQEAQYAVRVCRAYNDYVHDRYRLVSDRIFPMALIPMQNPAAAVAELHRAVKDLGMIGAMVPSTGLPLHVGHPYYWSIYQAAADLDCVLGLHGGSAKGVGMDTFTSFRSMAGLHHSIPLLIGLTSFVHDGILERFPSLRVAFLEGGCGWLVTLLDRTVRAEEVLGRHTPRPLIEYLRSGRVLIGCEGNDSSLPYLAKRVGVEAFAWASDYPHEVDLVAARSMIEQTVDHTELTHDEKNAVLGRNAERFFRLPARQETMAWSPDESRSLSAV
jgi:uncharacterized protein